MTKPDQDRPNPYEPSLVEATPADSHTPSGQAAGDPTYKIVTDTVTGVNVRMSDNLFQAVFIFITVLICAAIGSVIILVQGSQDVPWFVGAIAGSFVGLILGVILSGIVLMVYRTVRHLRGQHD